MTTAAVVLAAGGSTRFADGHKLLADFHGRALWEWAVDHALQAGLDETVLVVGAVPLPAPAPVRIVENPRWSDGMSTSVQAAIAACDGHEAVVIGLADQPTIPPDAWSAVAAGTAPISVATYSGRRGNPVRLSREVWPLLPVSGDEGARVLMRAQPELVEEIECWGDPADVDTVEDLRRWS